MDVFFPVGKYKKQSPTNQRLRRLHRDLSKLRDDLDGLLHRQHPKVAGAGMAPRIYYDKPPPDKEERTAVAALHELLERDVGETINGHVPARLLDLYLKIEWELYFLSVADCDGDAYRDGKRSTTRT